MLDTPDLARRYCPGCEPDADLLAEILQVWRCPNHPAVDAGEDDRAVQAQAYLSGSSEAGGDDNRRFCDFIHRGRTQ